MKSEKNPRSFRLNLFRVLAVLVAVSAIGLGIQERSAFNRARSSGKSAVVDPISEYKHTHSKGGDTYTAQFTFKTDSGETVSQRHMFPEELIKDFEHGRPVTVFYESAHPSNFVFAKDSPSWLMFGIGAGFLLAAIFLL